MKDPIKKKFHDLWLAIGMCEDSFKSWGFSIDEDGWIDVMIDRAKELIKLQRSVTKAIDILIGDSVEIYE